MHNLLDERSVVDGRAAKFCVFVDEDRNILPWFIYELPKLLKIL